MNYQSFGIFVCVSLCSKYIFCAYEPLIAGINITSMSVMPTHRMLRNVVFTHTSRVIKTIEHLSLLTQYCTLKTWSSISGGCL
ncbi:hypothetical protein BGX38DRAFT_1165506 [Terfezia claveryi]|nr:hypothetical protein BGX38DRAFT_1165506 [Terfezia claveryi]